MTNPDFIGDKYPKEGTITPTSLSDKIAHGNFTNVQNFIRVKDAKKHIKNFIEDIKTICPNAKFNKEVDKKAIKHLGDKLMEIKK